MFLQWACYYEFGVDLFLGELDLVIADAVTGIEQMKKAEAVELAKENAERGRTQEQAARIAAENRVRQLEEELRRVMNRESQGD